jgi:hypothetical protein
LNLFAAGTADVALDNGTKVTLVQATQNPWMARSRSR